MELTRPFALTIHICVMMNEETGKDFFFRFHWEVEKLLFGWNSLLHAVQ